MRNSRRVSGEHILYHYLQKDLRESDVWVFQMLVARLVAELGIWFAPSLYRQIPVLLPFAVRDPTCRKRGKHGVEAWGAPNELGYFRDDNSMIKSLPTSLEIRSPRQIYSRRKIGAGFIASHVWRVLGSDRAESGLASRDPWTNSFIPNLVWLPKQVAKLTDREGSFSQQYLQALARKIYCGDKLPTGLREHAEGIWDALPAPAGIPEQGLPEVKTLNFFEPTPRFVSRRLAVLSDVLRGFRGAQGGQPLETSVVSKRYTAGLPSVSAAALVKREQELGSYLEAVQAAVTGE